MKARLYCSFIALTSSLFLFQGTSVAQTPKKKEQQAVADESQAVLLSKVATLEKSNEEANAKLTLVLDRVQALNVAEGNRTKAAEIFAGAITREKLANKELLDRKTAEDQDSDAAAKASRMLRYGVSAGVALSLITQVKDYGLKGPNLVAMPYVAVLPAYFAQGPSQRVYCASTGLGESDAIALRAANYEARQTARLTHERNQNDAKLAMADAPEKADNNALAEAKKELDTEDKVIVAQFARINAAKKTSMLRAANTESAQDLGYEFQLLKAKARSEDPKAIEELENNIVNRLAERRWKSDVAGACRWNRVGVFLGRPLNFTASTTISGKTEDRTVSPTLSFGGIYMPSSYFSFTFGGTYASLNEEGTTNKRPFWALTFGIGGTLDIGARLLGK